MEYNLGIEQGKPRKTSATVKVVAGVAIVGSILTGVLFFMHGKDSFLAVRFSAHTLLPISVNMSEPVKAMDVVVEESVVPTLPIPVIVDTLTLPEDITAQAIMVKDVKTGASLYTKDEYTVRSMASITKLMTALVLLEHGIDWEQYIAVTTAPVLDTHMYAGDVYTAKELWESMLVASSNKAAYTLAESTGWGMDAFVSRMNDRAMELGMGYTRFTDPTGLDSTNVSTAADISLLLEEALRFDKIVSGLHKKEIVLYSDQKDATHKAWNTNWLLLGWIPHEISTFVGGKTGYITESGYNFTMQLGDKEHNMIHVVVLGAESHEARFTEARDIAKAVFAAYEWPKTHTELSVGEEAHQHIDQHNI